MKRYIFTLLFMTLPLLAAETTDNTPHSSPATMTAEEIELEREKIKLQREQLELERQKLEVERLKMQNRPNSAHHTPAHGPARPKPNFTEDLYLGFDYIITGYSRRTTTLNGVDEEYEAESQGHGFKLGFGTMDENRVEIAYSKVMLSIEEEQTSEWDVTMLSLDYLFVYYEAFGEQLSPFIKVGLTSASSDSLKETLEAMGYTTDGDKTISGIGLRLGLGLFYIVDRRMELSFGLDSTGVSWADTTLSYSGGTDKLELYDSIGTTYLTLTYHF